MKYDLCAWLEPVVDIAREACRRILDFYEADCTVERKEDKTPLTEADIAAHNAIVAGLGRLTPTIPVLSEESATIPFAERQQWSRYWLVDPLDGTREFLKRNGEFTVNIALIEDHVPVLGVICVPVSGQVYYACQGHGAYRLDPNGEPQRLHVRSQRRATLIVAGSRSHRGSSLEAFLQKAGPHDLVSMGSSLKSCLVAEGKADIYPRLGPTSEWDTAAAQAVVEEAGGYLTDTQLQRLRYNTKESLLNPHFLVYGDASVDWRAYLDGSAD